MRRLLIILLCLAWFGWAAIFAEEIHLKSGKTIEGEILKETEDYIKIDIFGVPVTIFREDIESAEEPSDKAGPPGIGSEPVEENLYFNERHGLSITGPKGWHMMHIGNATKKEKFEPMVDSLEPTLGHPDAVDNRTKKFLVVFTKPRIDESPQYPFIVVKVEDISKAEGKIALPDYVAKEIAELRQSLDSLEILDGPQETVVNGKNMLMLRIQGSLKDAHSNDVFFQDLFYYYIKDSKIYSIICVSSPPSDFEEDKIHYQEVINSFTIK